MKVYGRDLAALAKDISNDEPLVLVRGKDQFAPHMLRDYAARCKETGQEKLAEVCYAHADLITAWQETHYAKTHVVLVVPDEKKQ